MSPRMVPLTVCARREYIAASTRLVHITTRNMFLPTDVFSILFCRSVVIYVTSIIRSTPLEMTSAAEAPTKREGFGCRALSAVSFQRTAFRCLFLIKESIRYPSTAQVDNTEHCYHTRLGKVKSPISQLYNFACAPPRREIVPPLFRIRLKQQPFVVG